MGPNPQIMFMNPFNQNDEMATITIAVIHAQPMNLCWRVPLRPASWIAPMAIATKAASKCMDKAK